MEDVHPDSVNRRNCNQKNRTQNFFKELLSETLSSSEASLIQLQLQLGHLADAFIQSDLHRLMHTLTHRRQSQPCKATASSSGAVRVKCLAQGHINIQLGGAGDQTSNLSVADPSLSLGLNKSPS